MNEKTTVYIAVKIELIRQRDGQSLSSLINGLLEKWIKKQKEKL